MNFLCNFICQTQITLGYIKIINRKKIEVSQFLCSFERPTIFSLTNLREIFPDAVVGIEFKK